jgi:hypothetical protein
MRRLSLAIVLAGHVWLIVTASEAKAAPCLLVTLTCTMSGPVLLDGVAGAGTASREIGPACRYNRAFNDAPGHGTGPGQWDAAGAVQSPEHRQRSWRDGATGRCEYLMLTHLAPQVGQPRHGPWNVPGGGVTAADYRKAVEAGGFIGNTIVGSDLATQGLPAK